MIFLVLSVSVTLGHIYNATRQYRPTSIALSTAGAVSIAAYIARLDGSFFPDDSRAFAADIVFNLLLMWVKLRILSDMKLTTLDQHSHQCFTSHSRAS